MSEINVAVIGTGWIGELRADVCGKHPLVKNLYISERDEARAQRVAEKTGARRWVTDYRELLDEQIDAVIVAAAPETTHYPIAKEWLERGTHVLLEKPMAVKLSEGAELVELARQKGVKFTIGYTQRYNPKFAYVKQSVEDGTLGKPVSALVSRHITRSLGGKIAGRGSLGPVQMEATHDIDLVLWWMAPAKPVRVYSQAANGVMREKFNMPDCVWTLVTMDNGTAFTVGAGWNLPLEAPGFAGTWIEFLCTEGSIFIDDTHRDILLTTVEKGIQRPLSSMPGQPVGHVFAGPMENETRAFVDCVALDRPVLVKPEEAFQVMELTLAADLSAERGAPVDLPLPRD